MFKWKPDNIFVRFLARLADLFLLQLLLILTSIPLVTIGASISATYSVCRKLRYDNVSGIVSCYFKCFAANWKQATVAWLLFLCVAFTVFIGLQYYTVDNALRLMGRIVVFLIAITAYLVSLYLFPMIAWLEQPLFSRMKNALMLSLIHLKTTLLATGMLVAACLTARYLYPVFLFCGISGTIYILTVLLLNTLRIYSTDLVPQRIPAEE